MKRKLNLKAFPNILYTKRLTLTQRIDEKFGILYYDLEKNNTKIRTKTEYNRIGEITIVDDGEIMYKIIEEVNESNKNIEKTNKGNGYIAEALNKILEICSPEDKKILFLKILNMNKSSQKVAFKTRFTIVESTNKPNIKKYTYNEKQ